MRSSSALGEQPLNSHLPTALGPHARRLAALLLCLASCILAGCPRSEDPKPPTPNTRTGPPAGHDGAVCGRDSDCDGEVCLSDEGGFPRGYCTTPDCFGSDCHGTDAHCIVFIDESSSCYDGCQTDEDCRDGYRCRAVSQADKLVCFPDDGEKPSAGSTSAACDDDDDCTEGLRCDGTTTGGYCLTTNCLQCPERTNCAPWGDGLACLRRCVDTDQCRIGHVCRELQGNHVCVPADDPAPSTDPAIAREVLGVRCDAELIGDVPGGRDWWLPYEVPEGAAAYVVVPFVDAGYLRPTTIATPSQEIDLVSSYRHHNIRASDDLVAEYLGTGAAGDIAFDWPIGVPYAPDLTDLVEPGAHRIRVTTSAVPPCVYVVASIGATKLRLNVFLVSDLLGVTADEAAADVDLLEVFSLVEGLLGPSQLSLSDVEFFDPPAEMVERYAHIHGLEELRELTGLGSARDETLEGHLSVDVFLVSQIGLGDGSAFGISAGLPGAPGMHGNTANGLVFVVSDIGVDNAFVAHVMAHELGHFLGLRHTTEFFRGSGDDFEAWFDEVMGITDPIDDTPECDQPQTQRYGCPDASNLMFPAPPESTDVPATITPGQATVLSWTPLAR